MPPTANAHPHKSANERFALVHNGVIENYKELKKILPEVEFRSETDTEVLLELFIKLGVNSFNLLNGMFAFAIWDNLKNELTCARDRFGEKPFFYYHTSGELLFSSEIKALWQSGIKKNVNNYQKNIFYNLEKS